MELRSQRYSVKGIKKKTKSKWVNLVDVGDVIQFKVYSQGRGGSGTTFHLIKNGEVQYPNGDESDRYYEENNAIGINIVDAFFNNLELNGIDYD